MRRAPPGRPNRWRKRPSASHGLVRRFACFVQLVANLSRGPAGAFLDTYDTGA